MELALRVRGQVEEMNDGFTFVLEVSVPGKENIPCISMTPMQGPNKPCIFKTRDEAREGLRLATQHITEALDNSMGVEEVFNNLSPGSQYVH